MKNYLIVGVVCLAAGWLGNMYLLGPKVITKTEMVEVERVVTDIREVIKENPDGSREIVRETVRVEDRETKMKSQSKPSQKDWMIGGKMDIFTPNPVYQLDVSRRIIGDIYLGAYGRSDGIVGIGVTVLF